MKHVVIYTDGACSGNPGPGGWGAILIYGGTEKEISGADPSTTNNRMEVTAAIEALKKLREPCRVEIFSDSSYLVNAFGKNWIGKWISKNWRIGKKDEVKNIDLWKELIPLAEKHSITWNLVKGHAGDDRNNRCDKLAVKSSQRAKSTGDS